MIPCYPIIESLFFERKIFVKKPKNSEVFKKYKSKNFNKKRGPKIFKNELIINKKTALKKELLEKMEKLKG